MYDGNVSESTAAKHIQESYIIMSYYIRAHTECDSMVLAADFPSVTDAKDTAKILLNLRFGDIITCNIYETHTHELFGTYNLELL